MKLAQNHPRIATFAPIGADIFLVIYPIFLIILYLRGIIKKQLEDKQGAIFIFLSCLISVATNIFLQYFFIKNRPQIEIIDGDKIAETLLDDLLPTSSFPSDHAVVGMSVAIATLIR
ncbi:MAG: hypothetical protein LBD11_08815 [Candidatus Peribacteria bacterium]|nr:hypothetical protein [Candidatus Peribacteria bacterium]